MCEYINFLYFELRYTIKDEKRMTTPAEKYENCVRSFREKNMEKMDIELIKLINNPENIKILNAIDKEKNICY